MRPGGSLGMISLTGFRLLSRYAGQRILFFFFLKEPPPPKFSPFPLHAPLPLQEGGSAGPLPVPPAPPTPGADFPVTTTATGGMRNTTTNREGLYTFPSLPPGVYELKAE